MTIARKGLILAVFQCLLAMSIYGKLLYDRASCSRVWVKTARWDPNLPLRGRYLSLRLTPEPNSGWYQQTNGARVAFFVPGHVLSFEKSLAGREAPELWAEVTIPRKGPPRPIRLAIKKARRMELLDVR